MSGNRIKLWIGLGAYVVAGAAAGHAMPGNAAHHGSVEAGKAAPPAATADSPLLAAGQGGEGGEGGEAGAAGSFASPEAAFAGQLQLMKGHLRVGRELLRQGAPEEAMVHFHHPAEEIYDGIADSLAAHGAEPFKADLERLATLVEQGTDRAAIDRADDRAEAAIDAAIAHLPAALRQRPAFWLDVAVGMLRQAAAEYREAVEDGRIANVVEYQDARGFVWQARDLVESVGDRLRASNAEAFRELMARFADLQQAWPSALPPQRPVKSAGEVAALVSGIELLKGRFG